MNLKQYYSKAMALKIPIQLREKLEKISHIFAGVIILFHAYEKYESEHGSYIYFVLGGVIFLSIALFHHRLKVKFPWIDNCFFAIEGFSSLIIGYDFLHLGKKALPFFYFFAGLLQLSAIYFFSRKKVR